jgi:glycosyl transferase family 25
MLIEQLQKEGVFVIHALKGYEYHAERINNLLAAYHLNYEFVTDGDVSFFTPELLAKYFAPDILDHIPKGIVSCTLNHIYAYQKIVERKLPFALILENDPCFLGNFLEELKKRETEIINLPQGYIVSLENTTLTFPSYWQVKHSQKLYPAKMGRMAGAYLIDFSAAKAALADLEKNKCSQVIDWWHNTLVSRSVLKLYWFHPPLVEQGSHNGLLSSTISSKSSSWKRKMKWFFQKNYKYYVARLLPQKRLL